LAILSAPCTQGHLHQPATEETEMVWRVHIFTYSINFTATVNTAYVDNNMPVKNE
jgi:hypothetical protein